MADRPDPYVRKDPNDIIRSGDWNELQILAREHLLRHTHTGRKDDGSLIPGAGIDPAAEVSVRTLATSGNLSVGGDLKVNGKALLGDIADLLATVKGLHAQKLDRAGDTLSGDLTIREDLLIGGNVGIGTLTPETKLEVAGVVRAHTLEATNPLRHRMYPGNPLVYQDIFDARNKGRLPDLGRLWR